MRLKNIFGSIFKPSVTAKFTHEESTLKDGELHVKRIVKTGADAEKEIEAFTKKHFDEIEIEIEHLKSRF